MDFIGNYKKNFLIPVALSGDRTLNKDTIRRYVAEGNRILPGCSTIHFDKVAKKRIYAAIDAANFNDIRLIKESYQYLKKMLGRIPGLTDFERYGEMDVQRIFDNKSLGSYYQFLKKYEKEYTVRLSKEEEQYIELISKKFADGKRVHELELLKRMLRYSRCLMAHLKADLKDQYEIAVEEKTIKNLVNVMTNEFPSGTGRETYRGCVFIEPEGDDYKVSRSFQEMLQNQVFADMINELVEFGLYRNQRHYSERYMNTSFQLYQKYTYDDVCRLLEWERGEVALNIGGYKYDKATKTYPVFINYIKEDSIESSIKYEDRFLSPSLLIALSKSGRTPGSEDVVMAYRAEELGIEMELFVRKNKDDKISKEFYYLGKIKAVGEPESVIMKDTNKTAVEITYLLKTPVREDIYDFLIN